MKTILEINATNYSSTGHITLNIAKEARKKGYEVYTACKTAKVSLRFNYENQLYIGNRYDRLVYQELAYVTGLRGHFNILNTRAFLKKVDEIKPDLIHLHVLHDTFINLSMLFEYINKHAIPVIWTFHDCWAFTGQCPYFDIVGCDKWKKGCHHCPQIHVEPKSLFLDTSRFMWNKKRKLFNLPQQMTIVTPSRWLADLTRESFFKNYPIKVINNGINLDVFKPAPSDFRERYNLKDKYILLGVANEWGERKGLDVFIELATRLDDSYQIVLVGTNDNVDKQLPANIISIHKTYNQKELAEIYTAADLFVNPTREENFPTVNIEALACGLPVITFETGGSVEIIDEYCGQSVKRNDIDALIKGIADIRNSPYERDACIRRSKNFNMSDKFQEYIALYDEILAK